MGNENSVYQSINQVTSLNQQINVLTSSAASVKISQSFVHTIQSSYKSIEKLKEEAQKVKVNSSIVNSMEKIKSKSQEVNDCLKNAGKENSIKNLMNESHKHLIEFIKDIRNKKISMKAELDISKSSIDKITNMITSAITNTINIVTNVEVKIDPNAIDEANDKVENKLNIDKAISKDIKDISNTLKELKIDATLIQSTKKLNEEMQQSVKLIKDIQKNSNSDSTPFSKLIKGIKTVKSALDATKDVKDIFNSIKELKGPKVSSTDIKKPSTNQKYLPLPKPVPRSKATVSIVPKSGGIAVLNKIPKQYRVPLAIGASAGAFLIFKKIKQKSNEKYHTTVSVKDKISQSIGLIKGKLSLLSKPISIVAKTFISPALNEQKKQNAENLKKGIKPKDDDISNAAHQMERVKNSMDAMKGSIGKVFLPIIGGALKPVADWLQKYQPKIEKFLTDISKKVAVVMQTLQPTFKKLFENLSKTVTQLTPTFKKVFDNIPVIVKAMQPVLEKVFDGIGVVVGKLPPVFDVVIKIVGLLGRVWKSLWPIISSVLETAWAIAEPIFSMIISVANLIVDIFTLAWPKISGAIEGVWNFIKPIIDLIAGGLRKIADVASSVANFFGINVSKGKSDVVIEGGSKNSDGIPHAIGLSRVPYDNYPALLHEGEKVLTKQEVNSSRGFGSVNIGKLAETVVVREEADIDKIASAMVNKLQSVSLNMA